MRWPLALCTATLLACGADRTTPDAGPRRDGGAADAAPGRDDAGPPADAAPADAGDAAAGDAAAPTADAGAAPGFEHCPAASAYVGDPAWTGRVTTGGALLCAYPRMFETAAEALAKKRRVRLVAGTFGYPLAATDAPFRLPACLEATGAGAPPEILAGTVSAERREDFQLGGERYVVDATQPLAGGTGRLELSLTAPLDATALDLSGEVTDISKVRAHVCATADCTGASDVSLWPCHFASNTCDEFTLDGGSLAIDQFHWAGSVGAGFAAAVRVRGSLDGVPIDVTDYRRLQVTYGHHAFSRGLVVFFDAPIGAACGLEVAEIAEGSGDREAHLLDCSGQRIGTRAITAQNHRWREACPR